jgi:hypothetical protein
MWRRTLLVVVLFGMVVPGMGIPTPVTASEPASTGVIDATPRATVDAIDEPADNGSAPRSESEEGPPDPDEDVIGWENGYWYNESIDVDQADGLSDAELDRFVARTMARVERIRGLEFRDNVTIDFISRDEMRRIARNRTFGSSANDGIWEALFLVGENRDAREAFAQYHGELVLGFAAEEGSSDLVLVTANPDRPQTDEVILAHELMHVLQHQHFDLYQDKYDPATLDGEFGKDGVVEGEATLVHKRYQERCGGSWTCVGTPAGWADVGSYSGPGLQLLFQQPYADGGAYVHALVESEGWSAVDAAHESLPSSSEQVIHVRDAEPAAISIEDAATDGWQSIEAGESRTQRLGEAAIFTLFRMQSWRHNVPELDGAFDNALDNPYDGYNYTSRPSAGWGNDRLLVYRNGDQQGYVWKTVWDSERDAREFREAYVGVLEANGANRQADSMYVIEEGPFADAFRVTHSGDTVTIVNGPTVDSLAEIRPRSIAETTAPPPSITATPSATATANSAGSTPTTGDGQSTPTTASPGETTGGETDGGAGPGFGVLTMAVAVLIAIGATGAWRRTGS